MRVLLTNGSSFVGQPRLQMTVKCGTYVKGLLLNIGPVIKTIAPIVEKRSFINCPRVQLEL